MRCTVVGITGSIGKTTTKGTETQTPPSTTGGATSRAEIYKKDDKAWTWRFDDHDRADLISKLAPVEFVPVAEESGLITVEESEEGFDIRDVPPQILEMLALSGVCLAELEELVILEETVYGK